MRTQHLDRIDKHILQHLQLDGRVSNIELSKRVGLSPSPCLERVRKLEKAGFIQGYHARLNAERLGAALLVYIEITLNRETPDLFERFSKTVKELDEIQECYLVSGGFDFLLKARVPDMTAYRALLSDTLMKLPGISDSRTYVVMEEVKNAPWIQLK